MPFIGTENGGPQDIVENCASGLIVDVSDTKAIADAIKRLADDIAAQAALKDAQRAWISFRDAKCGYWQKRYEGGTIASVVTGDCMRVETGRRALEMRVILDDLDP